MTSRTQVYMRHQNDVGLFWYGNLTKKVRRSRSACISVSFRLTSALGISLKCPMISRMVPTGMRSSLTSASGTHQRASCANSARSDPIDHCISYNKHIYQGCGDFHEPSIAVATKKDCQILLRCHDRQHNQEESAIATLPYAYMHMISSATLSSVVYKLEMRFIVLVFWF